MIMADTRQTVIHRAIESYFQKKTHTPPYDYEKIAGEVMQKINAEIVSANGANNGNNSKQPSSLKYRGLTDLGPNEVASILTYLHTIKNISLLDMKTARGDDSAILGIYQTAGTEEGIYVVSSAKIDAIVYEASCRKFNRKDIEETKNVLSLLSPTVLPTRNSNLTAVANGIYDQETSTLLPFSSEYVFLSKSPVEYDKTATNPIIYNADDGTQWDIESWVKELSDDPGVPELLWQIISAALRPNHRWDKSVWLYSQAGNNGKGTLCKLIRGLVGAENCASISVADFSKEFMLSPLISASMVLTDENDVNLYIDRSANYKAAVTGDPILINRKFEQPVTISFSGLVVECMNGLPKTKDKSGSFYRRLLLVPFKKSFTGVERKYIKADYLQRDEVLKYALKKALELNFDELSEPAATAEAFTEYKEFNNNIIQFWEEVSPQFQWDKLPIDFVYDLYCKWHRRNSPEGKPNSKIMFKNELKPILDNDPNWTPKLDRTDIIRRPAGGMPYEPLITEYELEHWYNPAYRGTDPIKRATGANVPDRFRGLVRTGSLRTSNKSN